MKKKTKTYFRYKKKSDSVDFWNKNYANEGLISSFLTGQIAMPYHIYYMNRFPNGGAPKVKIYYREPRKK